MAIQITEKKFIQNREIQFGIDEEGREYSRFRYLNNSGLSTFVRDGESPDGNRTQIRDTSLNFFPWKERT